MKPVAEVKKTDEEVVCIPPELIRRFKRQPRKRINQEDIDELAQSIQAIGQIKSIIVKKITDDREHLFELVDGECRWLACKKLGISVRAIVNSGSIKNSDDQFLVSVAANFGYTEHTPMEIAFAIGELRNSERFKHLNITEKMKQIAKVFVKSELWVHQYLSLLKLDPKVQAKLDPRLPREESINLSAAFRLAFLPPDLQIELAEKTIAEGLTLKQINLWVRKMGQRAGIVVSTAKRSRRPSDDYRILRSFAVKAQRDLNIFFDPFVLSQLRRRSKDDLTVLARDLESCAKRINGLAATLLAPGKPAASEKIPLQPSVKVPSKPLNGKKIVPEKYPEESDAVPPISSDLPDNDEAGPSDEDVVAQFETTEPRKAEPVVRVRVNKKRDLIAIADDCCLGIREAVKSCSDVLTVLCCGWEDKRREFAARQMRTNDGEQNIYVKYAEDGCKSGEAPNKEAFFYSPFIVFGKFFPENSVKSDEDYLEKRRSIKDQRIRMFYPVDIKKYKKVFPKGYEKYSAIKMAK
jgi:ParB family transcriptional regulator, chromosome partitioning protein